METPGSAGSSSSEADVFRQVLRRHISRYPRLEVQDLYKLVYQGALGSEHAAADPSHARVWLEREVEKLAEGPEEQVIDPISADGRVVRVNLRPYVAGRGDLGLLLEGFARTAKDYRGTEGQLRSYWRCAERMAEEEALTLAVDELRSFFKEMERLEFPAVHHSQRYERAYRPAYRVVVREYLVGLY